MQRTKPLQRKTQLKRGGFLQRGTALKRAAHPTYQIPRSAFRRSCAPHRYDKGRWLRPALLYGSWRMRRITNAGDLILQAEHHTANSISFGDLRNIACLCRDHHLKFKPQHGRVYWECIERYVTPEAMGLDRRCRGRRARAQATPHASFRLAEDREVPTGQARGNATD